MSFLPDNINHNVSLSLGDLQRDKAVERVTRKARREFDIALTEKALAARFLSEVDRMASEAAADAMRAALSEEINLLDYAIARSDGSLAKLELGRKKVEALANINNSRSSRIFGRM